MRLDILSAILVAAGAGGFGYALFERMFRRVTLRDLTRPLDTRPVQERLQTFADRLFAAGVTAEKLERAGTPWGMTPARWSMVRLAALAGAPLLILTAVPSAAGLVLGAVMGWFGPDFVLAQLADDRRRRIAARVPIVADLTATVAAAGAPSVAHALQRVLDGRYEFDAILLAALKEADAVGMAAALHKAGERTGCEEGRVFCSALVQAHSLGSRVAQELRAQARQIHTLRAHARKAHMEKAKTYLTLITVLFMFVPLIILALLPAWGTMNLIFSM